MVGHIDSSSHVRSCLQLAYIQLSFEQVAAHPGFQPCHRRAKLASASPSLSKPSAQEPASTYVLFRTDTNHPLWSPPLAPPLNRRHFHRLREPFRSSFTPRCSRPIELVPDHWGEIGPTNSIVTIL